MGLVRNKPNRYRATSTILAEAEILAAAEGILRRRFERRTARRATQGILQGFFASARVIRGERTALGCEL